MRVQIEIFLGTVFTILAAGLILIAGLNEDQRMADWETQANARSIELGADLYAQACAGCHGPQGKGVPGLCPPLNDKNFFTNRLDETGWSGSLEDYIISTISAGRLASTRPDQYVGNGRPAMPSWSEEYGGPFRPDEIQNIADYILNWREEAMAAPDVSVPVVEGVGADISVSLPEGDAARGEVMAATLGCAACHISVLVGPAWLPSDTQAGIGTRAEERFAQADYTGNATSAQQYMLESIVLPNVYVVDGYNANIMPPNYADTVTAEQAADLIAYLLSLK